MFLQRTFAPWLLVAFLGYQLSLSTGERRRKDRRPDNTETAAPGRTQGSGIKSVASGRGKFSFKDYDDMTMQCTWVAQDEADTVRLSVKCENPEARVKGGTTDLVCKYNGKPQLCPGYQSDPKGFWKQVGRTFKKLQSKVCSDDRALVRTAMCKRAPRNAHFKLDIGTAAAAGQSGVPDYPPPSPTRASSNTSDPSVCAANSRKRAEEHCNSSWVSLCTFVFSVMQGEDC